MEQTQYWLWTTKRNQYDLASTGGSDSWEEQAFAEDAAAGALGGCIWPPRSYSCTFCQREFRSAQALGGHMNVHRRDRARLKQSETPQTEMFPHSSNTTNNSIRLHPGSILNAQSRHQTCNLMFNPNLDFDHRVDTTSSSPIRVSPAPTLVSKNETQYLFPYVQKQSTTIFPQKSSFNSGKRSHYLRNLGDEIKLPSMAKGDIIIKANPENPRVELESTTTSRPSNKRGIVKADLSISLNLVICRNNNSSRDSDDDDDDEDGRCNKKLRFDPAATLNLFNQQASHDVSRNQQLRMMNRIVSSIDDIDLELRLGGPPRVK